MEGKLGDHEEPQKVSKELEKEQSSSSIMNHSQCFFKMEEKVDIKPYQGEIYSLKLNPWLQYSKVYFSIHHIEEKEKIPFSLLKLEGHALP